MTEIIFEIESPEEVMTEEFFEEVAKQIVSPSLRLFYRKPNNRRAILEKYGEKAFLLPDELKFPVVNTRGNYDCGLIYAARVRARQWMHKHPKYKKVAEKADELYQKQKCEQKIHIHLRDAEELIPVENILIIS